MNKHYPLHFGNSEWIDFNRFSRLLGVKEGRLREGFLDQLGFKPYIPRSVQFYEVRQCPECHRLGYHCTLFDLAIIQECPWHRKPLNVACVVCGFPITFQGLVYQTNDGQPQCCGCGKHSPRHIVHELVNMLDGQQSALVAGYCHELVDWWATARTMAADHQEMLEKVATIGESDHINEKTRFWHVGYAIELAQRQLFWKFSGKPVDVKHVCWKVKLIYSLGDTMPVSVDSDTGRQYRSTRRYIYKRYIKYHTRCVAALMTLSRTELLALDSNSVCPVALAFIVWRMSVEGVKTADELRTRREPYRLALMTSPNFKLDHQSQVQLNYMNFFGIWHELRESIGKFTVSILRSEAPSSQYVETHIKFTKGNWRRKASCPVIAKIHVLFPKSLSFLDNHPCESGRYKETLFDQWAAESHSGWYWTNTGRWDGYFCRIHQSETNIPKNKKYIYI